MKTENKYIKIEEYRHTGKTKGFYVRNKKGDYILAEISWYGAWRQYCVEFFDGMIFNSECLDLIAKFLKDTNIKHRKNWVQKNTNYENI